MTLHLLFSASSDIWQELTKVIQNGDALLLIGDGTYFLNRASAALAQHPDSKLFARESDVIARSLSANTEQGIKLVTDEQWVELTLQCDKTLSWRD